MNIMTPPAQGAKIDLEAIAASTSQACIATRVRQLSRIITRVYDDALRSHKITASQFTLRQRIPLSQRCEQNKLIRCHAILSKMCVRTSMQRDVRRPQSHRKFAFVRHHVLSCRER